MNTTTETRLSRFMSEHCTLCSDGHLNPHPQSSKLLVCSLCETVFALVGDRLEELNPQVTAWLNVTAEIDAVLGQAKETLRWEVPTDA